MSENSSAYPPQTSNPCLLLRTAHIQIPPQLKFIMSSMKTIVTTQLTTDNHPIWKSKVLKLSTANGFEGYLHGTIPCPTLSAEPDQQTSNDHSLWLLIDQNLAATQYSTISPSLLPYVLNLQTCKDNWHTIEARLQSTNPSRIIHLKHDLDNFSMKTLTMTQYLTGIKTRVDAIAAAVIQLDPEDIIHHTLNGLSPSYQIFKTTIRTNLQPLTFDDFYSLLCSEESNIAADNRRELQHTATQPLFAAFYTNLSRGRGRSSFNKGRNSNSSTTRSPTFPKRNSSITYQICNKTGHSTSKCWHHSNLTYQPTTSHALAATTTHSPTEWLLNTGATAHLTPILITL